MKDNNLAAHPHFNPIPAALFSDCKSCERASREVGNSEERAKLNEPGRMKLIIHDLAGRLLTEQEFAKDEKPVLSVQNWNQGLYLYILQTASGEVARGKFSVIH